MIVNEWHNSRPKERSEAVELDYGLSSLWWIRWASLLLVIYILGERFRNASEILKRPYV